MHVVLSLHKHRWMTEREKKEKKKALTKPFNTSDVS